MATYDENLNIVAEVNSSNFPQYRNIRYNIGSIRKHTGELKDYFNKIFDRGTITSGSITCVLTPDDMLVEHYNPKTKTTTFEQVYCFYFNNVVIHTNEVDSYLKYYKLQEYNRIIEKNPNASHNPNAKDKYRFVYTCQEVNYDTVLDGYYGINGWELLVRDPYSDPLECYKFQKDGESKKLFNPEYYKLTKKTRKLEKLSETVVNLQTGNTIQQVKFPGFYTNNKSFIRFANQLTSDTTQYKLADNKDSHHNDILPANSDNLGYENLENSKIILFNGFDNNYELRNIAKTDNDIIITYKDWTQNGITVTSNFQLRPQDKIYIVKRESSTVDYDNNKIYTAAAYGPYHRHSADDLYFNLQPKDFIYTLSLYNYPRICFTGPTYYSSRDIKYNTLYLKFSNSQLKGTYLSNSTNTLSNLNFTTLISNYQGFFTQTSYNQEMIINNSSSYGDIIYQHNNSILRSLEFISQNKKVLAYDMNNDKYQYDFVVSNIKINISGSIWKLKNGTQPKFNDFTVNSSQIYKKTDCLSIVSAIDNKPGMLPNYINLLSKIDTTALVEDWLVPYSYNGTLKENHVIVSNDLLSHISSIDGISYDLKYTTSWNDVPPLFLRFGFESKTYTPSVGYIIFIELNN